MVELGVPAQDLDHFQRGVGVVGEEPGPLDPPVELEGLLGLGGAVEDVPDEWGVELWGHGTDRVLEAGGPGAVRHHPADDGLGLFGGLGLGMGMGSSRGCCVGLGGRLLGFWGRRRMGGVGMWKVGFGEGFGRGGGEAGEGGGGGGSGNDEGGGGSPSEELGIGEESHGGCRCGC